MKINRYPALIAALCLLSTGVSAVLSQDALKEQLPRIAPLEPDAALQSFEIVPGLAIEQVAAEPLVHSPVAISFDEQGRAYVVEMCDYSEQANDFLGKIRILEDTNGDGRFDKSTVFVEKLSWPTAVICYDGGVFVGAAPDILYLKDTNGDLKADEKKVVFTGFGRSNVQGLLNSFQWGLDNRVYGATSNSGAAVKSPDRSNEKAIECRGRDFSFDPRSLDFRTESGGAQHGLSFDDWGHKYVSSNGDHLQMIVYDNRYAARNRSFAMPASRLSIAADGPQAEVFRISPIEPWRIIRSEWRRTGKSRGTVEGGGQPAGYFTGATGVTIYRGDVWPEEFRGQAIVGDVGSNIVHRKVLDDCGVTFIGKRIDDKREFVASTDIWFRPAQFANAPDGTLYILDVYREVIEHPLAIPPEIKEHLDLTSGRDRGRLYRITPTGHQQRPVPQLAKASTEQLVQLLTHRNGWHRDTAARLLYERQEHAAVDPLRKLVSDAAMPETRIHAAYALKGLGSLPDEVVLKGLSDLHPRVREHAIRLAESRLSDSIALREKLNAMTDDADVRVRFQLAFTLGELPAVERGAPLSRLAIRDVEEPWITAAIFSSLSQGSGEVFQLLSHDAPFRSKPQGRRFLQDLARQVGAQNLASDLAIIENVLAQLESREPIVAAAIVRGLAKGVAASSGAKKLPASVTTILDRILAGSRKTATDEGQPLDDRLEAIGTLSLDRYAEAGPVLKTLLNNQQPQPLQLAAIKTLGEFPDEEVGQALIDAWPTLTPRVRTAASDTLFSRQAWLSLLFDAIESEDVPLVDIDYMQLKGIELHKSKKLRGRAQKLLSQLQIGGRENVLKEFRSALTLTGDADHGKTLFQKTCAACHRLEGFGHEIGPNLATFKNRGVEAIYTNILDPNREVSREFMTHLVETKDGRVLSGIISQENDNSLTLLRGEKEMDVILRADIERTQRSGRSLMPEGVEKLIEGPQGLADVIAYIMSQK